MLAKLAPILGITFIDILGFSILIPILPYYVQHFNASYIAVGVLFGVFALCQFVAGPLWGNVSDRIGRKMVLIVSQIGATIGWTLLAFAPNLAWVFVARIIEGISGGNISVTQAYVADRIEPEQRSQAFALIGAAFSAGFVLGPAAGGYLFAHLGYQWPFLLAAALQVITLFVTIFALPENVAEEGEKGSTASFRDIGRYLTDLRVSPILLQKLSFSLALYAWFGVFALFLKLLLNFGPAETSYFFALWGVFSIAFQLGVVGRLVEAIGPRRASNIGFVSACLFFVAIPFVHTIVGVAATMAIFSFSLSVINATIPALLTDASPDNVRGTVLGVGAALDAISGVIMPTASTAVLTYFGTGWTGAISAAFAFAALVLGINAQRRERLPAVE